MDHSLPLYSIKNAIIESVRTFPVTIINTETSSGKSTQVPQYLYEAGYGVILAEPRRLAAVSLADRVAEEMGNYELVGYHTGFETTETPATRILCCTDGLQLVRSLVTQQKANKVLILDEIHEQNMNQEMLLAWVHHILQTDQNIRVVLMSATMNVSELEEYFGTDICNTLTAAGQCFEVEFNQAHPEDMLDIIKTEIRNNRNILVFLPGKSEISAMTSDLAASGLDAMVIPLHGDLTMSEQRKCFAHYDKPKVILSTNIAQASVTVPDIDCVVDSGLERCVEFTDGISGLFLRHISQAAILQRLGRAGRTKCGVYYLCSYKSFDDRPEYSVPEIRRCSLEQVVLRFMSVGLNPYYLKFYHPIKVGRLDEAFELLTMLGALDSKGITPLGKRMVKLPISARYARMLIEAERYGLVESAITLTAILEVGSILGKDTIYSIEGLGSYSDIVAELLLWNRIKNFNSRELYRSGYNSKAVYRVQELRKKLQTVLEPLMNISDTGSIHNLVAVYLSGMLDNVYASTDREYYANARISVRVDNKSNAASEDAPVLVGQPRAIEFKDKWGSRKVITVLSMCAEVSPERLMIDYPNYITTRDNRWESYYSRVDGIAHIQEDICFKGVVITTRMRIDNDCEVAQILIREANECRYSNHYTPRDPEETVELEGVDFRVQHDWNGLNSYIYIDGDTLQRVTLTTVADAKGNNILFKCSGLSSMNLQDLKSKVAKASTNTAIQNFKESIPKNFTMKTATLQNYFGMISEHKVTPASCESIQVFVGLVAKNRQIGLDVFMDKASFEVSTKEALKFLVQDAISAKYKLKDFRIKTDSGYIQTKKCERAYNDFVSAAGDLVSEVTLDTYKDTLEFIAELYQEFIASLTA